MAKQTEAQRAHSSDLETKLSTRRGALREIGPDGWLWVPFCGFGECPQGAGYPMDRIVGCDIDGAAVEHWQAEWPQARIFDTKAEHFRDWPGPVALADFDAYGAPYMALQAFLETAPLVDGQPVQVLLTDGTNKTRYKSKRPYNFQTHKFERMHSLEAADQMEHLDRAVCQWLDSIGWNVDLRHYFQNPGFMKMAYFWLTLEPRPEAVRAVGRPAVPTPAAASPETDEPAAPPPQPMAPALPISEEDGDLSALAAGDDWL